MYAKSVVLFAIACAFAAVPATAKDAPQKSSVAPGAQIYPGADAGGAAPEAADKSLGMAFLSASINDDGSIAQGSGVVSSQKYATGHYFVHFNRPIDTCDHLATIANSGGIILYSGIAISVAAIGPDKTGVWVGTRYPDVNTAFDRPFTVMVFCAR